jgi:hypothetical protein
MIFYPVPDAPIVTPTEEVIIEEPEIVEEEKIEDTDASEEVPSIEIPDDLPKPGSLEELVSTLSTAELSAKVLAERKTIELGAFVNPETG